LQKSKRYQKRDSREVKRGWRSVSPQLVSQNKYNVLSGLNKMDLDKYIEREMRCTLKPLREIWLNIRL